MNRRALRQEVEQAAFLEVERVGPAAFRPADVVARFVDRGVDRATLFRWLAALGKSGRLGTHLAGKVREAASLRRERAEAPSRDAAREAASLLPRPLKPEEVAAAGGMVDFVSVMSRCIAVGDQLLVQVTNPDGTIRAPRLALAAADHLRRTTESCCRIALAMRDLTNLNKFHQEIIREIASEDPVVAERLLNKLHVITNRWAPEA